MLVICEDCAKKYNIDESRIKARRARFTCNECGHIIIIDKADLSRPLLSGKNPGYPPSSTIDLLREMEEPISHKVSENNMTEESEEVKPQQQLVRRKNRGIPLFVYFIITMLFSLIAVSLVTGYLYSEYLYSDYLSDILNRKFDAKGDLLVKSSLIFGAAWFVILLFISILALSIHRKFRVLVKNANQLSTGDYNILIIKNGPREVRDLAFALERIRSRFQSIE